MDLNEATCKQLIGPRLKFTKSKIVQNLQRHYWVKCCTKRLNKDLIEII